MTCFLSMTIALWSGRWMSTVPKPILRVSDSSVSPCWATYFFQSRLPGREKSRQKRLAPAYGSRCARLPSIHRCSGGRRTSAIHGPLRGTPSSRGIHAARSPMQRCHSASWKGYSVLPGGLCKYMQTYPFYEDTS